MLRLNKLAGSAGLGALILISDTAHAQETAPSTSGATFRFEGKIGAEYNSNVAIQELDANTGQGDWAATISALGEVTGSPVEKLTLRAGYEFSQSLHEEFNTFDIALHRGYGEASYDFSGVTAGVIANLAQANLAGDKYLTFTQVSPYLSRSGRPSKDLLVAA